MNGISDIIVRYYKWAYKLASHAPVRWQISLIVVLAVVLFALPFWLSLLIYVVLAVPFFAFGKAASDKSKKAKREYDQIQKSFRLNKQMSRGQRK